MTKKKIKHRVKIEDVDLHGLKNAYKLVLISRRKERFIVIEKKTRIDNEY